MDEQIPSPDTTLAILFGASEWPNSDGYFHGSKAFSNAMTSFKSYLRDSRYFGLPQQNILDLFDVDDSPHIIDNKIRSFLKHRIREMRQIGNPARDLLVYFVGHGGFVGRNSDYYLAVRCTSTENASISGIPIETLATSITDKEARYIRRIVILDCCYAAAAFSAFQAEGPARVGIDQTYDAFQRKKKTVGKGTSLFCSSGKRIVSQIAPDGSCTMFSKSLLQALTQGDIHQQSKRYLSLQEIADLTQEIIDTVLDGKPPRPEVHSPDQNNGDVANVPLFPNAAWGSPEPPLLPEVVPQASIDRTSFSVVLSIYHRHASTITAIAWSPDGKRIASGSMDNTVRVWDTADGKNAYIYRGHSSWIGDVVWSPDGKRIASASADNTVQIWDAFDGGNVYTYKGHIYWVNTVAWSPDGKRIASAGADKTVQVWDATDGGNVYTYEGHIAYVNRVVWSPDSKRIASGSWDKTVQIWNAADGRNISIYRGHSDQVRTVAWSSDGTYIASGGNDYTVQVWYATTGENVCTYRGHSDIVYTVTWSPDHIYIASGGDDTTVQIWNAVTGRNIYTYRGHSGAIYPIAWSPNGECLASGSVDSTIHIWQAIVV